MRTPGGVSLTGPQAQHAFVSHGVTALQQDIYIYTCIYSSILGQPTVIRRCFIP